MASPNASPDSVIARSGCRRFRTNCVPAGPACGRTVYNRKALLRVLQHTASQGTHTQRPQPSRDGSALPEDGTAAALASMVWLTLFSLVAIHSEPRHHLGARPRQTLFPGIDNEPLAAQESNERESHRCACETFRGPIHNFGSTRRCYAASSNRRQ